MDKMTADGSGRSTGNRGAGVFCPNGPISSELFRLSLELKTVAMDVQDYPGERLSAVANGLLALVERVEGLENLPIPKPAAAAN